MRLILMRHCKSSWASPGLADHDRPLNGRGHRSAEVLGDWLRAQDYIPDLAIVSTSRRTRETFDGLGLTCPARFDERLYHASDDMILRVIEEQEPVQTLLVIGHNPGFAEAAWRMVAQPVAHPRFADYPTGATLVVDLPITDWIDASWGKGNARDFVIPRALLET